MHPLVTIGIPTYNRPVLLRRTLECVANQDYPNLEVIIADNCTPGSDVMVVVESYRNKIKNLRYIKRITNIGLAKNSLGLIDIASGKYFMWLADDDEITKNYVSSLVQLLEDNPDASCAMGNWVCMVNEKEKRLMKTTNLPQRSPFHRALHFVWKTDDAFCYGIHRTSLLREVSIPDYWWPNRNSLVNTAYILLLDIVLSGRVLLTEDQSVQWINHSYTQKYYERKESKSFIESIFIHIMRRINVHCIYWKKISQSIGFLVFIPIAFVSLISLGKEFTLFFYGLMISFIKREKN